MEKQNTKLLIEDLTRYFNMKAASALFCDVCGQDDRRRAYFGVADRKTLAAWICCGECLPPKSFENSMRIFRFIRGTLKVKREVKL